MAASTFERYLRFGCVSGGNTAEAKFNPFHDSLGRFTNAIGSANAHGGAAYRASNTKPPATTIPRHSDRQLNTGTHRRPAAKIPGFPEDGPRAWRGSNDYAFEAAANFYNKKYGLKLGDSDYKTPHFLKAWAMRKSGGEGNRAAFETDPFQVNSRGDWAPEKEKILGIRQGQRMTPAISAYAALEWLRHKSLIRDWRGEIIGRRNLRSALQRYNGRSDRSRQSGSQTHGEWYADTILGMSAQAERAHR